MKFGSRESIGLGVGGHTVSPEGVEGRMAIRNEVIDELLAGHDPQAVFSQDGLLDELKKALAERILDAELVQHLASERVEADGSEPRNHRDGHSRKAVLTGTGKLDLQVPRDRQASFELQLIAKYRRHFLDFDDKVVSLYARGMPVREIQGQLRELYGIEVSPNLVSVVTDAVLEQPDGASCASPAIANSPRCGRTIRTAGSGMAGCWRCRPSLSTS